MGLENADFISELVDTWPVTATDPVTEGSNHLQLIKKVLQQTLPNYDEAMTVPPSVLNPLPGQVQDNTDQLAINTPSIADILARAGFKDEANVWALLQTFQANILLSVASELRGASAKLISQNASNFVEVGSDATRTQILGTTVDNIVLGELAARVTGLAAGSLLVGDIGGTLKKAGYRNPSTVLLGAGAVTLAQLLEGQIYESAHAARTITVPALDPNTTMTIMFREIAGNIVAPDGGVTLQWAQGDGTFGVGARNMTGANVVQLQWRTATNVYIWGNGIS